MDFFEHQAVARKKSGRLVVLFCLAVIAITAAVYALFTALDVTGATTSSEAADAFTLFDPMRLGLTAAMVAIVVGGGSGLRIAQLSGGGRVVAESLGGQLVARGGADAHEQRLLNVVEEMAIASGTPVPPVFVLADQPAINAFAAGFSTKDAVVGVTRGTLEQLDRDELQGVVAHEFSHILNGDMRLNLRLVGVLYGILCLSLFGRTLLRASHVRIGSRRGRSENSGAPILLFGLGLMLIGGIGSFFARWIQAAVSRQREFLADASAVQFTRNADGIAGALQKVRGAQAGSEIDHPRIGEVRHMLFGAGSHGFLAGLFATHPPLEERIRRLGAVPVRVAPADAAAVSPAPVAAPAGASGLAAPAPSAPRAPIPFEAEEPTVEARRIPSEIHDVPGHLTRAEMEYARELTTRLPAALRDASSEPFGARAVVYALLLDREDAELRGDELSRLAQQADARVFRETDRVLHLVLTLEERLRLPLLDLCLASLRQLSPRQYGGFRTNVVQLIRADGRTSPFELALRSVVLGQLDPLFGREEAGRRRRATLAARRSEAWVVTSLFAGLSAGDQAGRARAYADACRAAGIDLPGTPLDLQSATARLEEALDRLRDLSPLDKRGVLTALWHLVLADREVRVVEAELFRAVSEILDCPMPPLLAGHPPEQLQSRPGDVQEARA